MSTLFHLAAISSIDNDTPDQRFVSKVSLNVELVNSHSLEIPKNPDVLAQFNLSGNGNTNKQLKSLDGQENDLSIKLNEAINQRANLKEQTQEILKKLVKNQALLENSYRKSNPNNSDNNSEANNPARKLRAIISESINNQQSKKERGFFGASAKSVDFAQYVDEWREYIEYQGNLNYPKEARQRKLYGNLILSVQIAKDGSLEWVRLDKSSGHFILDQAAISIVREAAPFKSFPNDLAEKYDSLTIVRTWSFTNNFTSHNAE